MNTFTHAPVDCNLFNNIPPGLIIQDNNFIFTSKSTKNNSKDYALCIKKSRYGLSGSQQSVWCSSFISSCSWFYSKLSWSLSNIHGNCFLLVYVKDVLLFAKSDAVLDQLIYFLQCDFHLTSQHSIVTYIGIDFHCTSDGFLQFVQPGLIREIISASNPQDESNEHHAPATIHTADIDGPPHEHSWISALSSRLLTYLSTSTHQPMPSASMDILI